MAGSKSESPVSASPYQPHGKMLHALSCSTKTQQGLPGKSSLTSHHFCFCQPARRHHTCDTCINSQRFQGGTHLAGKRDSDAKLPLPKPRLSAILQPMRTHFLHQLHSPHYTAFGYTAGPGSPQLTSRLSSKVHMEICFNSKLIFLEQCY